MEWTEDLIGEEVIVTNDGKDTWRIGDVLAIEGKYITVGFYNPNSGDASIDVYDTSQEDTIIELTKSGNK